MKDNGRIQRIRDEYEHAKRRNCTMYAGHDLTLDIGFLLDQLEQRDKTIAQQAEEIGRLRKELDKANEPRIYW